MKFYFFIASLVASLMMFVSCNPIANEDTVEYYPFQSEPGGLWGMISTDGEILFEEEFKNEPTVVVNGRFFVKNAEDLCEIYTAEAKPQKVGDEYVSICPFTEDVTLAVKKNERITIIDKSGKVVSTLSKIGSKNIRGASAFINGLSVVNTDDWDFGVIDTSGKTVIEPNYMNLTICNDGTIMGVHKKYKDKDAKERCVSIMDIKGVEKSVFKNKKYNIILNNGFGKIAIRDKNERCGFIDTNCEEILKPTSKIKDICDYNSKYFIIRTGDGCGLRNFKNEQLIRPKYEYLEFANTSGSLLWAQHHENDEWKWSLINSNGDEISKEDYLYTTKFCGSHAFVKISDEEWGILCTDGSEMDIKFDICNIGQHEGMSWVYSDYVDLDAIVSAVNIGKDNLGDFGINMKPRQLIEAYKRHTNEYTEDVVPENWRYDKLTYSIESEKCEISYKFYYQTGYMTVEHYDDYNYNDSYNWNDSSPSYVEAKITGQELDGREDLLFAKIVSLIKTYGDVIDENDEEISVMTDVDGTVLHVYKNDCSIKLRIDHDNHKTRESPYEAVDEVADTVVYYE